MRSPFVRLGQGYHDRWAENYWCILYALDVVSRFLQTPPASTTSLFAVVLRPCSRSLRLLTQKACLASHTRGLHDVHGISHTCLVTVFGRVSYVFSYPRRMNLRLITSLSGRAVLEWHQAIMEDVNSDSVHRVLHYPGWRAEYCLNRPKLKTKVRYTTGKSARHSLNQMKNGCLRFLFAVQGFSVFLALILGTSPSTPCSSRGLNAVGADASATAFGVPRRKSGIRRVLSISFSYHACSLLRCQCGSPERLDPCKLSLSGKVGVHPKISQ